jgi:hypothetical protein
MAWAAANASEQTKFEGKFVLMTNSSSDVIQRGRHRWLKRYYVVDTAKATLSYYAFDGNYVEVEAEEKTHAMSGLHLRSQHLHPTKSLSTQGSSKKSLLKQGSTLKPTASFRVDKAAPLSLPGHDHGLPELKLRLKGHLDLRGERMRVKRERGYI